MVSAGLVRFAGVTSTTTAPWSSVRVRPSSGGRGLLVAAVVGVAEGTGNSVAGGELTSIAENVADTIADKVADRSGVGVIVVFAVAAEQAVRSRVIRTSKGSEYRIEPPGGKYVHGASIQEEQMQKLYRVQVARKTVRWRVQAWAKRLTMGAFSILHSENKQNCG